MATDLAGMYASNEWLLARWVLNQPALPLPNAARANLRALRYWGIHPGSCRARS